MAALLACAFLLLPAPSAHAATTRTEAETLTATNWTSGSHSSYAPFSGTGYKQTTTTGAYLAFDATVASGEEGTFSVVAQRTGDCRNYLLRLDGGTAESVSRAGGSTAWETIWTSPTLSAGTHTVEVALADGGGTCSSYATVDYGELTTSTASTTTTTAPSTTTTTAPSTTTTTAPEASTLVTPDNTTRQGLGVLVFLASAWFVFKVGRS